MRVLAAAASIAFDRPKRVTEDLIVYVVSETCFTSKFRPLETGELAGGVLIMKGALRKAPLHRG